MLNDDVDDNGSISEDDMEQHYRDLCGHNPASTKCEHISIVTDMLDIILIYFLGTFLIKRVHFSSSGGKLSNTTMIIEINCSVSWPFSALVP